MIIFEKKILDIINLHVRNNILSKTKIFSFAKKPTYITITYKYAFRKEEIEIKMRNADIEILKVIEDFSKIFFGENG